LTGCSSGLAQAVGDIGACQAAAAVGDVPANEPDRMAVALDAFAAEAPGDLRQHIVALGQESDDAGLNAEATLEAETVRARTLQQVRVWVAEHCESPFTLGTLPDAAVATAEDVTLDD